MKTKKKMKRTRLRVKVVVRNLPELLDVGESLRFYAGQVAESAASLTDRDRASDACDAWDSLRESLDTLRNKGKKT